MGSKVLVDSNVLIAIERAKLTLAEVVEPDDEVAVAVVTVGELQLGVEKSDDTHRKQRRRFLQRVVEHLEVIDYTLPVALAHAKIAATMSGKGLTRSRPDLMIAATALVTNRLLITEDEGFESIPGLRIRPAVGDARSSLSDLKEPVE